MPPWKIEEGWRLRDLDETGRHLVAKAVGQAWKLVLEAERHEFQHNRPTGGEEQELANQVP
jgi:hypothetical protein